MCLTVHLPSETQQAAVDVEGFVCRVAVQGVQVLTVPLPLRVASATAVLRQLECDVLLSVAMHYNCDEFPLA